MKLIKNTYRTFSGTKQIIEANKENSTQFVIYKDNKPTFFVDLFDLSSESNAMMNSLVLCAKRSMRETLELINRKNNVNLSLPKPSKIGIQKVISSEKIDVTLKNLPEEWLAYSL